MAPVSALRYISPRSETTGAAAVCTLIRLSPHDAVYLDIVKENTLYFPNPLPDKTYTHYQQDANRSR